MARIEYTSREVASLAARGLRNPLKLSYDEIQKICACALTQVKDNPEPNGHQVVDTENLLASIPNDEDPNLRSPSKD